MKLCTKGLLAGLLVVAAALPAMAQDSVSLATGPGKTLPGDAVTPWNVNEQCNNYVVDLHPFMTFSGTQFGIAPLVKSSKTATAFFSSQISAQSLSRRVRTNVPFHADAYELWNTAGGGINDGVGTNGEALNSDGTLIDTSDYYGNQFATIFSEFSTTDSAANYGGIIGAMVNYLPSDPSRLYVSRKVAAVNTCDGASNYSQFGVGSVDEDGNMHFRADGFGSASTGACGLTALSGDSIWRMNMAKRTCGSLNVVSNNFGAGLFDPAVMTEWLVRGSATTHNTPNMMPKSVTGASPLIYIGGNYNGQYVYGPAFGSITSTAAHLAAGQVNHRGTFAYTARNCGFLGSTHGMSAALGYTAASEATAMNVFGVNAAGGVTGKVALTLPANIIDVTTGQPNLAGTNEFNQYHGSVAFRGGNSPIALGVDQSGNLLAAAEVDHPASGGSAPWNLNYIAVARLNCATGVTQWTMAGYNYGFSGKPILDGVGTPIGQMVSLDTINGAPFGVSVSSPMIDSVGNVWFLSALELFNPPAPGLQYVSGLLRGVYTANYNGTGEPGYTLELVFYNHQVFHGENSGLDYEINFLPIATSGGLANSQSAWSSNISEVGHLGECPKGLSTSDPRTLGGIVINVEVVYDVDNDGDFDKATGSAPFDPDSPDQDYNVLMYIGALDAGDTAADTDADADVDLQDAAVFQRCYTGANGGPVAGVCADVDLDCDGDVDGADYIMFNRAHQAPR